MSAAQVEDVVAAQRGDPLAYARLVDATRNLVCAIALAVVRDVDTSEDVAQDVYISAWHRLASLREPGSFLPWLKQLTRRRALNFTRGERRSQERHRAASREPRAAASDAITQLERAEAERVVQACIDELPDESRELMVLYYREGSSLTQVAALLEIGEDAVKKRLERVRARLGAEVRERFAEAARRTAPTAAFTVAVSAALGASAPGTAAATSLVGAKVGSGFATLLGPVAGALGGLGGVWLSFAVNSRSLRDGRARRGLWRLSMASGALLIAWLASFAWLLVRTRDPVALAAPYLALIAAHVGLYGAWLPRLLSDDSAARRRYRRFMLAFACGATAGTLTLLYALRQHVG